MVWLQEHQMIMLKELLSIFRKYSCVKKYIFLATQFFLVHCKIFWKPLVFTDHNNHVVYLFFILQLAFADFLHGITFPNTENSLLQQNNFPLSVYNYFHFSVQRLCSAQAARVNVVTLAGGGQLLLTKSQTDFLKYKKHFQPFFFHEITCNCILFHL